MKWQTVSKELDLAKLSLFLGFFTFDAPNKSGKPYVKFFAILVDDQDIVQAILPHDLSSGTLASFYVASGEASDLGEIKADDYNACCAIAIARITDDLKCDDSVLKAYGLDKPAPTPAPNNPDLCPAPTPAPTPAQDAIMAMIARQGEILASLASKIEALEQAPQPTQAPAPTPQAKAPSLRDRINLNRR